MLSENGKIPGSRPIAARKAKIGASEVTGYAQAVSITPPERADLINGGLRMAFFNSAVGVLQTLVIALAAGRKVPDRTLFRLYHHHGLFRLYAELRLHPGTHGLAEGSERQI